MYKKGFKRLIDVTAAVLVLIFFLPLFIGVYLLLMLSQNSAFFTQDRPGKNGKVFKLINFVVIIGLEPISADIRISISTIELYYHVRLF